MQSPRQGHRTPKEMRSCLQHVTQTCLAALAVIISQSLPWNGLWAPQGQESGLSHLWWHYIVIKGTLYSAIKGTIHQEGVAIISIHVPQTYQAQLTELKREIDSHRAIAEISMLHLVMDIMSRQNWWENRELEQHHNLLPQTAEYVFSSVYEKFPRIDQALGPQTSLNRFF